jgi:hypothetical protein
MRIKATLSDKFLCPVDRAFKTPILGDASKFLNGHFLQPPVTGFEDDRTWGKPGGIRYPISNGNAFTPKGRLFTDKILTRDENRTWQWVIYDFKIPLMFFAEKAIGEWEIIAQEENSAKVRYSYTFYSKNYFYHLFTILFVFIQWKGMMKKALRGIKEEAESGVLLPYENER